MRCVNLDWFEVHCLESADLYPVDSEFFVRQGWRVEVRDYGTRVYEQMFTLYDNENAPFLEVRRKPKSTSSLGGVLDDYSCHIRLVNRYCYFSNAVSLIREFLARYHYTFRRIFRADICLDFELFDLGDDPAKFIRRYLAHRYAKINQCRRTTRGEDRWDGCIDNYVSWGNPKSMVSTKIYDKTKELREVHDKPYIRQAWWLSGLVDNPLNCTRVDKNGKTYAPTIWRLEFSVHAGTAGWLVLDDETGAKSRKKPIENTLEMYDGRERLLQLFASLAHHYFHFKYYEPGTRKDRCRDKVLFTWRFGSEVCYHLERVASERPAPTELELLQKKLVRFRDKSYDGRIVRACDVILDNITQEQARALTHDGWDARQVRTLQELLRMKLEQPERDLQALMQELRQMMAEPEPAF